MKKVLFKSGMWGIMTLFLFIVILSCTSHEEKKKTGAEAAKMPSLGNPEYVGSDKCKSCHWKEHDSWKHTLHSKFVQVASELTIIGDFELNNKLSVKVAGDAPKLASKEVTTTMFRKGDKFYINTIGPDWEFHDYEISHVIGINRDQNYITKFPNGEMHVLPVEWEVEKTAWEDLNGLEKNYPGNGKYWSDGERIWQFKCGGCHSTGLKINYDKATDSFDTTMVDLGIGCEACHGPGSDHITAARVLFDKEKETIINPAKLPWRLRASVCGQCHNWGSSTKKITPYREDFPERYTFPYGYKVGRPLYLYFINESDEEKKHHQQYNEWQKSSHAEAGIICSTCHGVHQEGLHKSPNKSQTKAPANNLCKGCHTTLKQKAAHRIHTYGSCIACHMPKTTGHEHLHSFKFISPEESIKAGGVDKKPNSCSGCHHHKDTPLAGLVEFLDAVKKEDMPVPFSVHRK